MKCIVVDDERLARELLASYLEKIPSVECVGLCKNAMEALELIQGQSVDLVLLDIQMPDMTGLDLIDSLSKKPLFILTTAYAEYALKGYELEVVDYMLKPIEFNRFVKGVNRAANMLQQDTVATAAVDPERDYIILKADKLYKMPYTKIRYIEGLREYVAFHTDQGRIVTLQSLKSLEEALPSAQFMRVHKSYIVNISAVSSMAGNQLDVDGNWIAIGKNYKDKVKELFR